MYDILEVIKNIEGIYENNTNLAVLKDFERVLDTLDMYAYENWIDGELAYGPQVDRHWITAGFMWPTSKMPNPIAAKRLTEMGCKVKYEKSHLVEPRKIKTPEDFRPGTKKGKLDKNPIWIVEIQMPKKLAFDMYRGYMEKMKNEHQSSPTNKLPVPQQPAPIAPQPMQPGIAAPTVAPAAGSPAQTVSSIPAV